MFHRRNDMNGNIDDQLGLKQGDFTVDARGWMQFNAGEVSADYAVTAIQGNVSGTGYKNYVASKVGQKMEWKVDVTCTAGTKFNRTTAHVTVTANVKRSDGSIVPTSWGKDVQLT
jgi:hypothetical protein